MENKLERLLKHATSIAKAAVLGSFIYFASGCNNPYTHKPFVHKNPFYAVTPSYRAGERTQLAQEKSASETAKELEKSDFSDEVIKYLNFIAENMRNGGENISPENKQAFRSQFRMAAGNIEQREKENQTQDYLPDPELE